MDSFDNSTSLLLQYRDYLDDKYNFDNVYDQLTSLNLHHFEDILPFFLVMASGCLFAIAILSAWAKFGRDTIAAKTLLSIPFYILWKIPLYFAFLVNRQSQWVRTERDMPLSQNSVASNRLFDKRLGYRETNQAFSSSASCFTSSLKPL